MQWILNTNVKKILLKQGINFSDGLFGWLTFLIIVCILNRKFVKSATCAYNYLIP